MCDTHVESDIHICGICKHHFSTIEDFIDHKQQKCSGPVETEDDDVDLPSSLNLNDTFGIDDTSEQQDDQVSTLRDGLLGLAAAAQAELLESSTIDRDHVFRTPESSVYHRGLNDDEEDVADVLANQLSGTVHSQVLTYETPLQTDVITEISTDIVEEQRVLVEIPTKPKKQRGKKISSKDKNSKAASSRKQIYKCTEKDCTYEGKYFKDLTRHLRVHTGEKPFVCDKCDRCFSRGDKLKQHKRIHSGLKPFECDLCSYASVDRSSLIKHRRTHTNERPCQCQLCPYKARDSSQLTVHLRTHTGDTPFACLAPRCDASFKTSSDLKRHTRLHTDERPFSCDTCNFSTRIKGNLLAHMRRVHLGGKKNYPCTLCNAFVAPTYSALQHHKKSHASILLRCNVGKCDYVGVNITAIRYHLRSKHPEECPLMNCKHCSFTCSVNAEMRLHLKEHHVEKKKRKPSSSKSSSSSDQGKSLKFNRTFKCPICSVCFVRDDSLRSHIRVHQRAENGQKGVVVVDTSAHNVDPDDPEEILNDANIHSNPSETLTVSVVDSTESSSQQMVFFVPSTVNPEPHDPLMLSPNSGNSLLEQLNLQQGVHYILVPSSTSTTFSTQPHSYQQ